MPYTYEKYYDAEDGRDLVLTLDTTVQFYLEKNLQNAEKVSRLLALDAETKNEEICDYMISGDQPEKAAEQILTSLNLPIHSPKPASRRKKK